MINKENIKKAITVMERVKANEITMERKLLNMSFFRQGENDDVFSLKEEDEILHSCGTTCCFAGWIAVSPEFREQGVTSTPIGEIQIGECDNIEDNMETLFGFDRFQTNCMVFGDSGTATEDNFYGDHLYEVTVDDVIEKLKEFL